MKHTNNLLFDEYENEWQKEWKDMPEFIQEDLTSFRKIVVHFRNKEDVKQFSELLSQKNTPKQPSLWYPEMPKRRYAHLIYVENED
jgi:hypothetical protein